MKNEKFMTKLIDETNASIFSIIFIYSFFYSFPSNIYYASISSKSLRFSRTIFDTDTFITVANQLLTLIWVGGGVILHPVGFPLITQKQ